MLKNLTPIINIAKPLTGLAMLLCAVVFASCGSDSGKVLADAPVCLSSTPADGDTDIEPGDLTVTILFDQEVTLAPTGFSKVTIDGAKVNKVSPSGKQLSVSLSDLKIDSKYDLLIGKGTVKSASGAENDPVKISFATKKIRPIADKQVTPNPIPEAKRLYDYLKSIYGQKIITGAMADVNWNIAEAELVNSALGTYPAMAVFDYIHLHHSPANWVNYGDISLADAWVKEGGIIGACWHWNVPASQESTTYTYSTSETTFKPANILKEGTWEREVADRDLDKIAGYLLLLQEKNIPVIWRPLHEAAGNSLRGGSAWFWWGRDGGETYGKLWRYVFDFFAKKGVRNLIWVWTGDATDSVFYPGDDYVDIVGCDVYTKSDTKELASDFKAVQATYPGKMIAMSECGNVAKLSAQWEAGAHWLFAMPWYDHGATSLDGHKYADKAWWNDALTSPYSVTRSNISMP